MSWMQFGDLADGRPYRTVDERAVRASSGIMLAVGVFGLVNGFVLRNFAVIPYVAGFLLLNFAIGLFLDPNFAPTMFVGRFMVRKQTQLPIGALQKRFAWSLGLALASLILVFSLLLQRNAQWFEPTCMLCVVCILLLYLETAFGICVGCKLYLLALALKILKEPEVRPNCMGDACQVESN